MSGLGFGPRRLEFGLGYSIFTQKQVYIHTTHSVLGLVLVHGALCR